MTLVLKTLLPTPPTSVTAGGQVSNRYIARFNAEAQTASTTLALGRGGDHGVQLFETNGAVESSQWTPLPADLDETTAARVRHIVQEVETRRVALVKSSFFFNDWVTFCGDLTALNPDERATVRLVMHEVKPLIDQIEALQQNGPAYHGLRQWMGQTGNADFYAQILWERFHRDTLAGAISRDPAGSLFPFFPDKPLINGMIDASFSLDEVKQLTDAGALRPTTVLEHQEDAVVATPLPLHATYRELHGRLSTWLTYIVARHGQNLHPKFVAQLEAWAQFFKSGQIEDEARAVQATIDAGEDGGPLRLHIGPSEAYWPDQTKFPYLMALGLKDQTLAATLQDRQWTFQELEDSLAGVPGYTPRTLSPRGGFADPMRQLVTAGFLPTYQVTEPLGYNFPNVGYEGVEGQNRFVVMEGLEAQASGLKVVLGRILDEDVSAWDAQSNLVEFVCAHESGHAIGPLREFETPNGRMGQVFGDHWGSGDEPLSDLIGAIQPAMLLAKGQISEEKYRDLIRAFLAFQIGPRYLGVEKFQAGTADHYYGHMIVWGKLLQAGAITVVETTQTEKSASGNRRLHLNYDLIPKVAGEMMREIATFQAAGDLAGFLAYGSELVKHISPEVDIVLINAGFGIKRSFIARHLGVS